MRVNIARYTFLCGVVLVSFAVCSFSRTTNAANPFQTDYRSQWTGCGLLRSWTDLDAAEGGCDLADIAYIAVVYPGQTYEECGWTNQSYRHAIHHWWMNPANAGSHCVQADNLWQGCIGPGVLFQQYSGWCLVPFQTLQCSPFILDPSKGLCISPGDLSMGNPLKCQCSGDPINTGSGNIHEEAVDYRGSGSFPLVFSRVYNSVLATESYSPNQASINEDMGLGWSTNVGAHLFINQYSPQILI